ncbi:MAG TPA: hypothetical protein VKU19_34680 [Bryobacteraceae bacterium]|nr:hypothetical protein [Bryobacteraceae bacterium]
MVQLVANSLNLSLSRVDDSGDVFWTAGAGAGIFGIARSASRNFTLGELPGLSGGTYQQLLGVIGSSSAPIVLLPTSYVTANNAAQKPTSGTDDLTGDTATSEPNSVPGTYDFTTGLPVFTSIAPGTFRFAIQCATPGGNCAVGPENQELWSSLPSDNTPVDSARPDHMVTWQLTGSAIPIGDTWYIAGFENGTSDYDFNDYVFLFQNTTPSGAAPEPGSIVLVAIALLALLGHQRLALFKAIRLKNRN